ncbi:substrate-binding periplasmic protein [Pseudomonas sp. XK-1]|uniref:substrate-binding periplasmic protein n=1 Tax=Pseudomonas sp. XK-1 TaxID=3136019 RepID=UPI003119BE6E
MRLSLLPTLFLTLMPTFVLAEQSLLRICYENEDSTPFWSDYKQAKPGLIVELVQSAAQQAGLRLELQRRPWKRCILQLQSGQSDGIFAAIWQADRDVWGQFPGRDPERQEAVDRDYRLWQVDYPIIISTDSLLQWNGQQFKGLQYGLSAPLGYIASQRLRALGVQAKVNPSAEKALQLVTLGRLDGYVIERHIGNTHIRKLGLQSDLKMLPLPLLQADWYLPLSHQFTRQYPQQAQRFWQALRDQRLRQETDLSQRYLQLSD